MAMTSGQMNCESIGFRHNMCTFVAAAALIAIFVRTTRVPPPEYVLVQDELNRRITIHRPNNVTWSGTLDDEGNFVYTARKTNECFCWPVSRTVNFSHPYKAYELRSGRLILGTMMPDGNFVPEVGCKVIDFQAYKYYPGAVIIWNLPGRFLRRDQLAEQQDWLEGHPECPASYWEEEYFRDKRLKVKGVFDTGEDEKR